ncbi:Phosphoribosylformylglycinamidine cyclo-ligase [Streptomyces badius]
MSETTGASYAAAGVDIEAGDRAVELMKEWVKKTQRPEVAGLGGLGGFAGLFDASALKRYERPLLASATDGVGTKVDLARQMGVYDTIGHDLVGMVVDDLVVCGAEPLFMTDYICVGKVHPERVAAIVKGIAEGCVLAGCALVGGETAEHPGLLGPDDFDVAGAGTGVVEADRLLGPDRIREGDAVIAMASSGLHSNGYSLVRHVVFDRAGWPWTARSRSSAARWARSSWSPPGSTPWTAWPSPVRPRCTASATSPAAAWPTTSPGSSRTGCTPPWTAPRGRPARSSTWSARQVRSSSWSWRRRSTWASA